MRRRSSVLTILLLTLAFSAVIFLVSLFIFTSVKFDGRIPYSILIGILLCFLTLAFGLNRAGHFSAAAGLIVACMVLASWISILLNLASLGSDVGSDVMLLCYIVASVIVSSFLLSTRVTFILAVSQLVALLLVSFVSPGLSVSTWTSLLGFIGFISLLSIISNLINRRDLDQIDRQTHQLHESETLLREQSVRDLLTGLFNRRYMEETLDRELSRAARKQLPLGIIMLDIDHFKQYNDTYGHAGGDELLRLVGIFLKEHNRLADVACRYGGEEFILIMPEASLEVTRERAEYMCEEIKNLHVPFQEQILEAVTISIGVAVFPMNGSNREAILRAADAALYQAKDAGRDRVIVAN